MFRYWINLLTMPLRSCRDGPKNDFKEYCQEHEFKSQTACSTQPAARHTPCEHRQAAPLCLTFLHCRNWELTVLTHHRSAAAVSSYVQKAVSQSAQEIPSLHVPVTDDTPPSRRVTGLTQGHVYVQLVGRLVITFEVRPLAFA